MNRNAMKGKVALIVGGTSGIGRACALQLAQRGYNIMIVGRNQEAGDSVVATVERAGVRGRFIRGDVSLMQEVRRIAAEIGQQTAAIHLLIHCTDVILNKRIETAEGVELSFATNFLSRFLINDRTDARRLTPPAPSPDGILPPPGEGAGGRGVLRKS